MTLCRYRPERKYDAQFIIDEFEAHGLVKILGQVVHEMGEAGLASTPYYVGARLALSTLFEVARQDGEVDVWTDFLREFESRFEELEGC